MQSIRFQAVLAKANPLCLRQFLVSPDTTVGDMIRLLMLSLSLPADGFYFTDSFPASSKNAIPRNIRLKDLYSTTMTFYLFPTEGSFSENLYTDFCFFFRFLEPAANAETLPDIERFCGIRIPENISCIFELNRINEAFLTGNFMIRNGVMLHKQHYLFSREEFLLQCKEFFFSGGGPSFLRSVRSNLQKKKISELQTIITFGNLNLNPKMVRTALVEELVRLFSSSQFLDGLQLKLGICELQNLCSLIRSGDEFLEACKEKGELPAFPYLESLGLVWTEKNSFCLSGELYQVYSGLFSTKNQISPLERKQLEILGVACLRLYGFFTVDMIRDLIRKYDPGFCRSTEEISSCLLHLNRILDMSVPSKDQPELFFDRELPLALQSSGLWDKTAWTNGSYAIATYEKMIRFSEIGLQFPSSYKEKLRTVIIRYLKLPPIQAEHSISQLLVLAHLGESAEYCMNYLRSLSYAKLSGAEIEQITAFLDKIISSVPMIRLHGHSRNSMKKQRGEKA